MFISSQKSGLTLLVLALVTISNLNTVNGASTFAEIDISKVAGSGIAIQTAAQKSCGTNLSAEELTRRHELADTAELDFFNPRIIESLKTNNEALNKALNCQKLRNKVLKNTCQLQANIKQNLKCETDQNTKEVASDVKNADIKCKGVDEKLFVTVTGINEPRPPTPGEKCDKPKQTFTSTYADVDITKSAGTGEAAKTESERVCGANLSKEELIHRSDLGRAAENKFVNRTVGASKPLKNALNCQKLKNSIMISTCLVQLGIKRNKPFQVEENTLKRQQTIEKTTKACANIDPKLFVTLPEGGSSSGKDPSGASGAQSSAASGKGPSGTQSSASSGKGLQSSADKTPIPSIALLAALLVCLFT